MNDTTKATYILWIILFIIMMIAASCSTTSSFNGYCEYKPIFHYRDSNLPEKQKDRIRQNNYVYDVDCLGIDYSKKVEKEKEP